jgi:hypothetical protein
MRAYPKSLTNSMTEKRLGTIFCLSHFTTSGGICTGLNQSPSMKPSTGWGNHIALFLHSFQSFSKNLIPVVIEKYLEGQMIPAKVEPCSWTWMETYHLLFHL